MIPKFFVSNAACQKYAGIYPEMKSRWKTIDSCLRNLQSRLELQEVCLPRELTPQNVDHIADVLCKVHSTGHVKRVFDSCINSQKHALSHETPSSPKALESALMAVASMIAAVNLLTSKTAGFVFCNVRPPGHHAGYNSTHGFCFFNNAMVAAQLAQEQGDTVAIVDWDVHHGDGTEDIVRHSSGQNVHFFSVYQSNLFPNVKNDQKMDSRINRYGITHVGDCNSPRVSSAVYHQAFSQMLVDVQKVKPTLIVVSCGFDSADNDPLGNFSLQPSDFSKMTRQLVGLCPRIISVLEGGYETNNLSSCLEGHLQGL